MDEVNPCTIAVRVRTLAGDVMGMDFTTIDTPSLVVDLDAVDRNIATMMDRFRGTGIAVRPHLKTTKAPEFARMLTSAGANGVCVAKLSEAEVMVNAGIRDILITTEIAGREKLERLFRLLQQAPDTRIVVDSAQHVDALLSVYRNTGYQNKVNVLIEVNIGQNRAGVKPGEEAQKLAAYICDRAEFDFWGVQGYEGHLQLLTDENERSTRHRQSLESLRSCVDHIRKSGITVRSVTGGGTGTCEYWIGQDLLNEVQPGSFVFMDTAYRKAIVSVR